MTQDNSRSVTVEVKRKRRRIGRGGGFQDSSSITNENEQVVDDVVEKDLGLVIDPQDLDYDSAEILAQDAKVSKKPKIMNQSFAPVVEQETEQEKQVKHKPNITHHVKKADGDKEGTDFKDKLGLKDAVKTKYDALNKRRGSKKIVIQNIDFDGEDLDKRSVASIKRAREKARRERLGENNSVEKRAYEVVLPEVITVSELSQRMAEKSRDVIKEFMKLGLIVNLSQIVDADTAELVITELGHKVKRVSDSDVENILDSKDDENDLKPRCPVVTIMGHVDHGKTSLLDAIRSASVTSTEAGGITQHIGAYQVSTKSGGLITFLDTPGHEAFSAMRSKGSKITDIVVLVVAADDGVKEQTKEAISHAKAAGVPIIVAINKIDKPGADPSRVVNELLHYDIVVESMGGDVMTVEVSATKKLNLEKLLEAILLQAEVLELKAPVGGRAKGVVIEAELDKSKGVVATILVQKGSLNTGDLIVVGSVWGKIKGMYDDKGDVVEVAGPSTPVRVFGLNFVPESGDRVDYLDEEKQARDIAEYRYRKKKEKSSANIKKVSLEDLFARVKNKDNAVLPVVIKADVHGSLEAIEHSLEKISTDEVQVKVLHKGVGGINESDVSLAKASGAVIVGFNVRVTPQAKSVADYSEVDIRYYSIIYNLIDEFKALMSGMLSPIAKEVYLGRVEIREVFTLSKGITVAGSFVTDGVVKRGSRVRLLRDSKVIHEGALRTLRRFKDDVKEAKQGYECGIALEGYNDIKIGDIVEVYEIIEEKRTL
ncbi:MAG: translation initiation factor IF-2 [Rickettsiales bacterium]|nr:translation initiation factor IF-2 [Rickettsiales bacterium]